MNPLISIAAVVFPEILKTVAGDKSKAVANAVVAAVEEITGTSQPKEAQKKVETDSTVETDLRLKLAEIAANEEEKRRQNEIESRKLQMEEAENRHKAELEALKVQFAEDAKKRDDDFRRLEAGIADTQAARTGFSELAKARNPFAWGPVIVSVIVVIGFFWILWQLLSQTTPPANEDVWQILNITIGALTAGFATVVSFWLGSSQGSRNKDFAAAEVQAQSAQQTARIIERQAEQTKEILKERTEPGQRPKRPTRSNFRRCVDIVLEKEGGYVNDPDDRGGPTNMGITFNTLKAWRGTEITEQDVKDLKIEEARNIYQANYWKKLSCDDLPSGVDLVVFDFGVNAGTARSAKLLQRVCGANSDGVIGPITVGAVNSLDAAQVIRRFGELRMDHYRSLSNWTKFGRGWTRRTDDVQTAALDMTV